MGLWGPSGKVGSLGLGLTVSLPAGLWGHGGFHTFQTWGNPPGRFMEKFPVLCYWAGRLGNTRLCPSLSPTPGQRFLALGKN